MTVEDVAVLKQARQIMQDEMQRNDKELKETSAMYTKYSNIHKMQEFLEDGIRNITQYFYKIGVQ